MKPPPILSPISGGNGNKESQNVEQCFNQDTLIFDLGCMDWVAPLVKDSSHKIATPRYTHAAARYGNSMVVVGGFNGQPMNDVLLYYPPREDCASVGNKDRKVCECCIEHLSTFLLCY